MKRNNIPEYEITDIKAHIKSPGVKALISYYQFEPSQEKIEAITKEYLKNGNISVYGCIMKDNIAGMIVIERLSSDAAKIIGIAVLPEYRSLGIGSKMTQHIIENNLYKVISAETDNDAVGFYKKCGFKITGLGYKYKNVDRYKCVLCIK